MGVRVRVRIGLGLGLRLGLGPHPNHGIVLADAPHQVGGIAGREVRAVLLENCTYSQVAKRSQPQPRDTELATSADGDEFILVELQGDHLG